MTQSHVYKVVGQILQQYSDLPLLHSEVKRNLLQCFLSMKVMEKCLRADGNRNANGDSFITPHIEIIIVICLPSCTTSFHAV